MERLINLLKESFDKFDLNLLNKKVLTEAASGNYICTSILAALAGSEVYALAKESKYGTISKIRKDILTTAKKLGVDDKIFIIENLEHVPINEIDIVTNTGFVRPINKSLIDLLKPGCVIPLMWEPWELRDKELDLNAAYLKGIKVYGTNENDKRLQTIRYLGFTVLYFLLKEKRTPFSAKILVIGCERFCNPIISLLMQCNYNTTYFNADAYIKPDNYDFDTIVIAEHMDQRLIGGGNSNALINLTYLKKDDLVIHISGNVDFSKIKCKKYPEAPARFGYMSYTTDFIDPTAVFDLHAAGLKVAEGMLEANSRKLKGKAYKLFMLNNYPALAFDNMKYW